MSLGIPTRFKLKEMVREAFADAYRPAAIKEAAKEAAQTTLARAIKSVCGVPDVDRWGRHPRDLKRQMSAGLLGKYEKAAREWVLQLVTDETLALTPAEEKKLREAFRKEYSRYIERQIPELARKTAEKEMDALVKEFLSEQV